jgi:hypothetical protein
MVFRRDEPGIAVAKAESPISLTAAATATEFAAAAADILFLLVTRCSGCREPPDTECE